MRAWAEAIYKAEAPRAALWLPVAFGAGVWLYFALETEPAAAWAAAPLLPLAALALGAGRRAGLLARALALLLLAGSAGFSAAVLHARAAAAPVLAGPVEETVDGLVIELGRSTSGAPRVTLAEVTVYGLAPEETPARLRVALLETDFAEAPRPGARIRLYARLFPPGGPVEPGGFDFRRSAWFDRLGAVGYTRGPVLRLPERDALDGARLWISERRARLADALRAALPGPEGAFAAAILVGDRSGIDDADAEALRVANLAHLLAISGLHMGILCGLVFSLVRLLAALVPQVSLHLPGKKLAAGAALLAGAGYLLLSGATVPTQRAYTMAGVALVAVLLDRPAITLRALGLAAAIVLAMRPVSLLEPGFQMSFAATLALVAGYEALRARKGARRVGRVWTYLGGLVFTSLVAGLATAPYAAFHFNRLPVYGLAANLVAVPAMGLWIAPSALLAAAAAPFGLADWPLALMGAGIAQVLAVAHEVASWPGAVRPVAAAPGAALALVTAGGLLAALLATRLRLAGGVVAAAGLLLWAAPGDRPEVLIAPGARLVGVMGPEGRAVDHPRAQSYAAETWLRRDGDGAAQEAAAMRPGMEQGRGWARAALGEGWRLEVVHGRRPEPATLARLCTASTILVARHGGAVSGPCCYLGRAALAASGAVAIRMEGGAPRFETARAGARLWSPGRGPRLSRCG